MNTEKLIEKITQNYSKTWNNFISDFLPVYEYYNNITFYPDYGLSINNCGLKIIIPNEFLFGLLEEFFYQNEIDFFDYYLTAKRQLLQSYIRKYDDKELKNKIKELRREAKYKSILKCFEINESENKNGN
jgi:hypothetical protein